jgi:hypothetical protein
MGSPARIWPYVSGALGVWVVLSAAPTARAADPDPKTKPTVGATAAAPLNAEVQQLRAKVAALEASRDAALQQIGSLRQTVEELQRRLPATAPSVGPPARTGVGTAPGAVETAQGETPPGPPEQQPEQPGAEPGAPGAQAPEVGESKASGAAQKRFQAERAYLEKQGGVLVPGGQLVIEPGFQYASIDRNNLNVSGLSLFNAIVIGRINVDGIRRQFWESSVDLRYGIHDLVQAELNVPYLIRQDRISTDIGGPNEKVRHLDNNGIGDLQFTLSGQPLTQRKWWPSAVLSLTTRFPTAEDPSDIDSNGDVPLGLGTYGIQPGLTIVRTIDPAVLFASFRYIWDIENDFGQGLGKLDYGDSYEYTFGLAFALNERLAFTASFDDTITGRTSQNGKKLNGTDLTIARLFIGTSYRLSPLTTFNLEVGIGLSNDAPGFTVQASVPLRMPYTFPHFE